MNRKKVSNFNTSKGPDPLGGQAVIEGVLMKSKDKVAIAVRKPNDKISVKIQPVKSVSDNIKILKLPFIRGSIALFETLLIGIGALNYSANEAVDEDEEKITKKDMFFTTTFALLLSVGLFILLPLYLTGLLKLTGSLQFNIIDGFIRFGIFILYLLLIMTMKDVRILFQYHGSEHKSVNCYEAGEELTVKNVKKHSKEHPRCGTTFLLIVMTLSIIVFSFITSKVLLIKFGARILLLPVIAGISYELLKFSAKHQDKLIMKIFIKPGLMLQGLTTREPTDRQIEVAIKALKGVL